MAERWIIDLTQVMGATLAYLIIYGIAVIPGFMNAFLAISLLLDKRPKFIPAPAEQRLPAITILVAAYNESASILATLESIDRQNYPGDLTVIAINDGSSDNTLELLHSVSYPWLQVLDMERNVGKARALTKALELVQTDLTLTVDGDSYLYKNALANLIRRYLSDPADTRAVAGAVLVRNSRVNLVGLFPWHCSDQALAKSLSRHFGGARSVLGLRHGIVAPTRRLAAHSGGGYRADLGHSQSGLPRRVCGECLPVYQCARDLDAIYSTAPALVAWAD